MAEGTELMTVDNICNQIYIIRGQQVMLDYDLNINSEKVGKGLKNTNVNI